MIEVLHEENWSLDFFINKMMEKIKKYEISDDQQSLIRVNIHFWVGKCFEKVSAGQLTVDFHGNCYKIAFEWIQSGEDQTRIFIV